MNSIRIKLASAEHHLWSIHYMVLEVLSRVIKIKAFKLFFVNFFLTTIYNNKKRLNL